MSARDRLAEAPSEMALRLCATFGHKPSEMHTQRGATGEFLCGMCFADWPCATVRTIDRVTVPVVAVIAAEKAAEELEAAADVYDDLYHDETVASDLRERAAAVRPDTHPTTEQGADQ